MNCTRLATFVLAIVLVPSTCWAKPMLLATSNPWNTAITASNPQNWYRLDELSGDIAYDYGSEGLDGMYRSGMERPTTGTLGKVGYAASFDGDRDSVMIEGSDIGGNWTAEFVLKRTGTKFSANLLRGEPYFTPATALRLEQFPNTNQVGFTEFAVADRTFSPAVATPLDEFVHLVYVNDGSNMNLYLNGVLAGTNPNLINLSRHHLGSYADSEAPEAIIDDVVIYGRALSGSEVLDHFNAFDVTAFDPNATAVVTPEPSTWLLFGIAFLAALAYLHRTGRLIPAR